MAKFSYLVIFALLISANLLAEEEKPSVELIEFLADWGQEDDIWSDTETPAPTATTEHEADDESEK